MKKILFITSLLISCFIQAQDLKTPSEGKSLIYFTRYDAAGFLINFKYFDGEKYLGKFSHGNYLVYECEPGKHIFWSKSENMSFIEADLQVGKTYIVDSRPQMGFIKAGVELIPFTKDLDNYDRYKKRIFRSLEDGTIYAIMPDDLKNEEAELKELIERGMAKYKDKVAVGKEIKKLLPENFYDKEYFKKEDLTNKK